LLVSFVGAAEAGEPCFDDKVKGVSGLDFDQPAPLAIGSDGVCVLVDDADYQTAIGLLIAVGKDDGTGCPPRMSQQVANGVLLNIGGAYDWDCQSSQSNINCRNSGTEGNICPGPTYQGALVGASVIEVEDASTVLISSVTSGNCDSYVGNRLPDLCSTGVFDPLELERRIWWGEDYAGPVLESGRGPVVSVEHSCEYDSQSSSGSFVIRSSVRVQLSGVSARTGVRILIGAFLLPAVLAIFAMTWYFLRSSDDAKVQRFIRVELWCGLLAAIFGVGSLSLALAGAVGGIPNPDRPIQSPGFKEGRADSAPRKEVYAVFMTLVVLIIVLFLYKLAIVSFASTTHTLHGAPGAWVGLSAVLMLLVSIFGVIGHTFFLPVHVPSLLRYCHPYGIIDMDRATPYVYFVAVCLASIAAVSLMTSQVLEWQTCSKCRPKSCSQWVWCESYCKGAFPIAVILACLIVVIGLVLPTDVYPGIVVVMVVATVLLFTGLLVVVFGSPVRSSTSSKTGDEAATSETTADDDTTHSDDTSSNDDTVSSGTSTTKNGDESTSETSSGEAAHSEDGESTHTSSECSSS
jgi:hypothetical protein